MKCLLILSLTSLCGLTLGVEEHIVVSAKVGQIRGIKNERGFTKFLGVPYGKVDTNNVFGAAIPHPDFEDIFEAYNDSISCVQVGKDGPTGIIDCLNLDIYVPDAANSDSRLPVMVWIHGGAYVSGSSAKETSKSVSLLKYDVIIVGINYRLGVFGFMCLGNPKVPGNTGLKDQVLALRWINENIEAFGGDANKITVFGEEVGGVSANLHLFSSYEKLFNRVIIQSGPANSYWSMVESDSTIPIKLAKSLGFITTNINEALSFLSEKDAREVAQIANDLKITCAGNKQPLTKPCIEQKFEGVENFITDHPMNMRSIKARTTQVMIGNNKNELASHFVNLDARFFDSYDFSDHFALGFEINEHMIEAIETVKHYYIGDENISEEVRWNINTFASDFIVNHPTQRMAQILLESRAKVVYRYIFSYGGTTNRTWVGAAHGEELQYLFNDGDENTSQDKIVIENLIELWTNFAKYGDPIPQTSELPVKWIPITKYTQPYLEIDIDLILKNRPYHKRMAFWDLFYKQYGFLQKCHRWDGMRGRHHHHHHHHNGKHKKH